MKQMRAIVNMMLLLVFGVVLPGHATDLDTTNTQQIGNFWQAVQQGVGPVTVMAFGDSVSDDYRSIQRVLFNRLQHELGINGFSPQIYTGSTWLQVQGGAQRVPPTTHWWADHAMVPPGGSLCWASPVAFDCIGLSWVSQPDGGGFSLSVLSNGATAWTPLAILNGHSDLPVGHHTNIGLAKGFYSMRLESMEGTNLIVGMRHLDRSSRGISPVFLSKDGQSLDALFQTPTNILYPILTGIDPRLVIWHMKELPDATFSNRLHDLEALWKTGVPNGDIVYIGTPFSMNDLTAGTTPTQNRLTREAAVRSGRAYVDCMNPCVSYPWMARRGFLYDGIHPSDACNAYLANMVFWPQLRLTALISGKPIPPQQTVPVPSETPDDGTGSHAFGSTVSSPESRVLMLWNPSLEEQLLLIDPEASLGWTNSISTLFDLDPVFPTQPPPFTALHSGEKAPFYLTPRQVQVYEGIPRPADMDQTPPVYHPYFLEQPASLTRYAGFTATFSARFDGTPPITCQWFRSNAPLPLETNCALCLSNVTPVLAGWYSVVASNAAGRIAAHPASLQVLIPNAFETSILSDKPLAFWRLNESAGPQVSDHCGGHDGNAASGVGFGSLGARPYDRQTCASFDAARASGIGIPPVDLDRGLFTVECWARVTDDTGQFQCPLASCDTGAYTGFCFAIAANRWCFITGNGSNGWTTNVGPIVVPGTWTFLAGLFDGTNQALFVNGIPAGQGPTQYRADATSPFGIGARFPGTTGDAFFSGDVDEVVIFPKPLASAQILEHYRAAVHPPSVDRLTIEQIGTKICLFWNDGILETSPSLPGAWSEVPGASSPWMTEPAAGKQFFRLRSN